jgi:hypothetical protein
VVKEHLETTGKAAFFPPSTVAKQEENKLLLITETLSFTISFQE